MRLLYITTNNSDVQRHLMLSLKNLNVECGMYDASLIKKGFFANIFRGPIMYKFWKKRAYKDLISKNDISKIDIVHGNMFFSDGYLCRKIKKFFHKPYIVSVRNTDLNLKFLWRLPWLKRMGYRNLVDSSAIIFLSKPYMVELLARFSARQRAKLEHKCFVVPNGIDDFWFENVFIAKRDIDKKKYIKLLTIGRIEDNKNQLSVCESISKLIEETDFKFEYLIVGDYLDVNLYNKLIKYDFVEIRPYKKKEDLIHDYRESDIFIMASHTETFGLVYAEALTQGLPVIYSKGQGFDGQFDEGVVGFSVCSDCIDDISDGILKTISNYDSLSLNATKLCSKFVWECIGNEMVDIYSKSIGLVNKKKEDDNNGN